MFELNLACRLARRGLPVGLPVNPDIVTEAHQTPIYIECKRPFKEETIPRNVRAAEKQLIRDLDEAANPTHGIIAISVSRALNPGDKLFAMPDQSGLRRLGDSVQQIGEAHVRCWEAIAHRGIIGILFHLITTAHLQDVICSRLRNRRSFSLCRIGPQRTLILRARSQRLSLNREIGPSILS